MEVTATPLFQHGTGTTCIDTDTYCELVMTVGTLTDTVEEQVSGSKTYEVRVTIGGSAIVDNDYVNTNIDQDLVFVASAAFASVDNDTTTENASFVWSDISAQSHDSTTLDWTDDYLVKNLATNTQNLEK